MSRKLTLFEKILFIVGLFFAGIGYYLLNLAYTESGRIMSYEMITAIFLWVIILFTIIVTALVEHQKEELTIVAEESKKETKLMKEMIKDQVIEIKLLRQDLAERHRRESR